MNRDDLTVAIGLSQGYRHLLRICLSTIPAEVVERSVQPCWRLVSHLRGEMMCACDDSVAVVGLGKLGLPLACVFASKGKTVQAIDSSASVVEAVRNRRYVGPEPRVADMLLKFGERIHAFTDYSPTAGTSAAFVIVNTPNVNGKFSLQYVLPQSGRLPGRSRQPGSLTTPSSW